MSYQLAQLNIAHMRYALESPEMKDFVDNLARINALADGSPGFIWRLQDDQGSAATVRPMGDSTLVNMSVWKDIESLNNYTYRSAHVEIMKRRKEWFDRMKEAHVVLWWILVGRQPDIHEAIAKLELLRAKGPTPEAFTFKNAFPPPETKQSQAPLKFVDECPA